MAHSEPIYNEIKQLIELMQGTSVSELTLQTEGRRVTIRRFPTPAAGTPPSSPQDRTLPAVTEAPPPLQPQEAPRTAVVLAPMVGIFHHAEPPVGIGSHVEEGQVVGIIESMRLMNEIRCEYAGEVTQIYIEAGMPVEYGQPLMEITLNA
ncbi:MAG: acetyl-CoA carboxylase biotin carboxyl carrier protein [Chthonomonadales bacterium]